MIKQGKICKTHEDFTVIGEINGHVIISEVPDTMISSKKFRNELLNLLDSLLRDDLDDDIKKTTTGKKIEKYFCQIASIEDMFEKFSYADYIRRRYKKVKEGKYYEREVYVEPEQPLTYLIYKLVELIIHIYLESITEKK